MANINLAPGTQYIMLVRKRRIRLFILSGVLLGLMFIVWGGLWFINNDLMAQQKNVNDKIQDTERNIAELGEDGKRVLSFESRLVALDQLLNSHVSWNPLLSELERLLPQPTVVRSINANLENGTVDISGETTDMDLVAQTLASLNSQADRNTLFVNGNLSNISTIDGGEEEGSRRSFNVTFSFDKNRLLNNQ